MLAEFFQLFTENPMLVIGNFFGLIAMVFSFITFQMATPKKLLLMNSCVIIAVVISYAFLGAWSGMAINLVCLARNFTYARRDLKLFSLKIWPYLVTLVIVAIGVLSWQGPISLLVIIALAINSVFMSFDDNNKLRLSVLLTSSMIIVYNAYFMAYFALIMEASAIVSSVIGLLRFRAEFAERGRN